jgi:hypothetical protein
MNTVLSKKLQTQCFSKSARSVPCRAGTQVDLFGAPIPEKPIPREKRLGYLSRTELLDEVRKVFPNAKVLPNIKSSADPAPIRAWLQRAWLQTSKPNR